MRLDGFGILVDDMAKMIRFYRDVLGFEIRESEDANNVYLVKDGTLFLLYGRGDFEKMTGRRYEYVKGLNGHFEIALYVDTFDEVDAEFRKTVEKGAVPVLEPENEPWGTENLLHRRPGRKPCRNRLVQQTFQTAGKIKITGRKNDFERLTRFYRHAVAETKNMELYAHWIYGLHPSDEMILGYISPENMFFSELDGKIASAVAVVSRQEKEYHDVPWKMNPADDEVSVVHILCVAPEFQKKGIAARTMRAVIEMSRESGKKAVHLDALKCNTPSARTFIKRQKTARKVERIIFRRAKPKVSV